MTIFSEDALILGIDPGTRVTGYGVIQIQNRTCKAVDFGCIRPPPALPLQIRYRILFEGIEALLQRFSPQAVAIETQFVNKNVSSATKLAMARAVISLAATLREIPLFEYSPTRVKKAVVGRGNATKEQVQSMLLHHLSLKKIPTPEDAADALALAVCLAFARC